MVTKLKNIVEAFYSRLDETKDQIVSWRQSNRTQPDRVKEGKIILKNEDN